MPEYVRCATCGEVTELPTCSACGAELVGGPSGQTADRASAARGQPSRERDQTSSERDQTASDQDQTWSDHDQTSSERDQRSSDADQRASDEDLAAGGDSATHDQTSEARARSTRDRSSVSTLRDESAEARLQTAAERDLAAEIRDLDAEGRDELARLQDQQDDPDASRDEILQRAERDRARAAADRARAADDRIRAAADREEAARERAEATRIRAESAETLKLAATDGLTGAWTRTFGLEEISDELERAQRTGTTLVLAFIDIDGLKGVNDREGHLAGDALLRLVGETIRTHVRPYDVIVRYGGDELVCAMPNFTAREARARLETMAAALSAINPRHSFTFGLAEADPADGLHDVIGRADADLLATRRSAKRST